MKRRLLSIFLSLTMILSMVPSVWAADEMQQYDPAAQETETPAEPELENPATSGTSGGIDWKVESGTLTISPSKNPENGYTKGQMVENYGTLTKNAPEDAAYIAALTAAGYTPGSNGHFYYPGTETWVSDSPWKFLSEQITSVVVENGVTSIAARAFRLPNVTEVSIPASVTSIGNLAFEACKKLTTVNWTGDWTDHVSMPFNGFSRCSSLGEGYELTDWMPACFYVNADSDSIEGTQFTVNFDELNNRLESGAIYPRAMFRSVPKITSATLTSQLNVDYIFEYSGIQSVTIADDQTSIATAAFRGCEGLTSVTIPESVTVIHMRAFADSGLKNITFSGSTSPTFGLVAFENVKLDSVTLNENMSVTEAVKIIGELAREGAITDSTTITPAKFANFNAENVVVDGAEGEAINRQDYPLVKNLTINGAYTSAVGAFGNSVWGKETLETLTIHAPGEDVTINATAFLRTPLKSVKIEAKKLAFTGDAAFLNTMLLTHVDLTGVDEIVCGTNGKRTFAIGEYQNGGLSAPTRYVYFKDAEAYTAMNSQFGGNTSTYYLVTNGGTVVGEQDGFSAVVKGGYTAEWHEKANFSDIAVETPAAGKVYYAEWTKSDNVTLTSDPAAENGEVSAAYNPNGSVTLSVQNPGAGWLYSWMKNGEQITAAGNSLTLCTPSESGIYSVQVTTKGSDALIWTSNKINVTITKAAGTASVSMDGWAYGETAKTPVPASATNGTENVTYQYKVKDADDSTYSAAVPTAAGSYTVKATFPATKNYEETAATTDFTIAQAAPTVSITAEPASLVGGGTVKLTVTTNAPAKVVPTCDGITVTENSDGTFSAVLPNETKTYTFTASYAGDDNHEKATDTCEVSVTRRSSSGGSSSSGRSYAVSAPSAKNGDVTVSPKNASKGDRVTITVTPDKGYELDSLTVKDASGNKLKLTDKGNGKYTFTMPGSKVTVSAEFVEEQAASIFADVPADAYYAKAVEWAVKKGITNGKANGLFGSNDPCTRGQIVTFLWRAAGSPAPKGTAKVPADVLPGSYCYDAVAWALENGITNGLADGTFGVNNTCTRGQSVTFLYRTMGTAPTTVNGFTDVAAGDFYAEAVAWAVENGVTSGIGDGLFGPDNSCTRAQIVTFLFRAYQGK